jgi:hypothetical protein
MARGFNSVPDTIILYANTATYKKVESSILEWLRSWKITRSPNSLLNSETACKAVKRKEYVMD